MPVTKDIRLRLLGPILVACVAVLGGCGGGSEATPAPDSPAASPANGGLVRAEGTNGLLGPAQRATADSDSIIGKPGAISRRATGPTRAQRHGVAAGAACGDSALAPAADNLAQVAASILCLLNAERADAGLPPLTRNGQLDTASQGMSDAMVRDRFFSHETPDGRNLVDRVQPTGYLPSSDKWVLGENLAWGSGGLSTPGAIVNGWMNSPGHKANVLAPDYKDIGIGIVLGSPTSSQTGGTTYTTDFGARPAASATSGAALSMAVPGAFATPLRRAVKSGVSYSARCSRACSLVGRLYLGARAARSARLGSKRVAVATGRLRLGAAGSGRLTVRMTARAKRALRNRRPVSLTLVTSAVATGVARSTRVTLR